jgi:hypothetical protein
VLPSDRLPRHGSGALRVVVGLGAGGAELVGELERYEDSYQLCYVRSPEGIIFELAVPMEPFVEASGRRRGGVASFCDSNRAIVGAPESSTGTPDRSAREPKVGAYEPPQRGSPSFRTPRGCFQIVLMARPREEKARDLSRRNQDTSTADKG